MSRAILWFRNDQRLDDNPALLAAVAAHDEVLPIFVVDPHQHDPGPLGMDRSGPFRRRFLHEGLVELDAQLRARGSALHVRAGRPLEVIAHLQEVWGVDAVHAQQLFAWEEQHQEREVASVAQLHLHAPNTLILPGDLPFTIDKLPPVFTAFRQRLEPNVPVRGPRPSPERITSPPEWKGRMLD